MNGSRSTGALDYLHAAAHWFGRHPDQLGARERKVLALAVQRRTLIEDPSLQLHSRNSLGERVADSVARLGGSWGFIGLFLGFLLAWVLWGEESEVERLRRIELHVIDAGPAQLPVVGQRERGELAQVRFSY